MFYGIDYFGPNKYFIYQQYPTKYLTSDHCWHKDFEYLKFFKTRREAIQTLKRLVPNLKKHSVIDPYLIFFED